MRNFGLLLAAILLPGMTTLAFSEDRVDLFHIHGLSYSNDGKRLYIPSHFGLAIFENGKWRKAPGPEHDYMGFIATQDAFYSSGHPAEGSDLVNPFGLMKSIDNGSRWKQLGMTGEADFHVMAAGYMTNMLYLYNLAPNSRIGFAGLAFTDDDGKTFHPAQAKGAPEPFVLATHPALAEQVAIGGEGGLFTSANKGATFDKAQAAPYITGLWYDLNGDELWYGGVDRSPFLAVMELDNGKAANVNIPALSRDDAIAYITQNPHQRSEYVIATFQRHVYITPDRGMNWRQIAVFGETQ